MKLYKAVMGLDAGRGAPFDIPVRHRFCDFKVY